MIHGLFDVLNTILVEMEGVEPSSRTGKTCAFYMLIRDSVFEPDKVPGGPAS